METTFDARVEPVGRCPACGYDVRGLREARCPECGGAFDADALRRGLLPVVEDGRDVLWVAVWLSAGTVVGSVLLAFEPAAMVGGMLLFASGVSHVLVVARALELLRQTRNPVKHRGAAGVALWLGGAAAVASGIVWLLQRALS